MNFNLNSLKGESVKYKEELRFPIKYLNFSSLHGNWISFETLKGEFETPGGNFLPMQLRDILLDTGNLTDYCLLPGIYKENFINKYKDNLEFEKKRIKGIRGDDIRVEISTIQFHFKFLDTLFNSKIGFRWDIDVENFLTINIGIKSMNQFLNIMFLDNNIKYYFCSNI